MGAERCQFVGGATANAAAAAGDNDGLASEQVGFENRVVSHGSGPLIDLVGDALGHRNLDLQQLLGEGLALRVDPQTGHATTAEGVFQQKIQTVGAGQVPAPDTSVDRVKHVD